MKKVLINAEPLDRQYAGIHYYLKMLREGFKTFFPDYPIFYLREKGLANHENDLEVKNTISVGRDPVKHFVNIPKIVKRFKPDVFVELTHFGPFRLPDYTKRLSVIHDLTALMYPEFHPKHSSLFQKYFLKHTVRNADRIVVNSRNTEKDVIKYYPEARKKTRVIYPGVEEFFSPNSNEDFLHKMGITEPYFMSLSTIEPRKNIETLLDAYKIFKSKAKSSHKLILTGKSGWKNKKFYKLLYNHPFSKDIKLTGYLKREDLPYLYSSADAFVFPSWYEGFGLPVLEALSCGTPCILSESSSLPEVGGAAAVYFDPSSSQELAEKMELIAEDGSLRNDLKKKAVKQSANFSLRNFAAGFIDLFEKM